MFKSTKIVKHTGPFSKAFDDFSEFFQDVDSLVVQSNKASYPKTDITHIEGAVVLEMAVPGLTKSQLSVKVKEGRLIVIGEKMYKTEGKTQYNELKRSSFKRDWALSDMHDVDNIETRLVNGILSVRIPVVEQPKAREIDIN